MGNTSNALKFNASLIFLHYFSKIYHKIFETHTERSVKSQDNYLGTTKYK